jgi:ubiquinol-cytochrome c reductase cytochrome b subunit
MIPGQIAPFVLFGMIVGWPFLEAWVTGDRREHHLLQRPRNAPTRTAFLAAMVTEYARCGPRAATTSLPRTSTSA